MRKSLRVSVAFLFVILNFLSLFQVKAQAEEFVPTDLSEKLRQAWGSFSGEPWALTSDSSGNIYIGFYPNAAGVLFVKYNPSTEIFTNLTPKIEGFPGVAGGSGIGIRSLTYDSANNAIYLGGGVFLKYSISTDVAVDLSSKISPFSTKILSLAFDPANETVYLGGEGGYFAKYTIATDIVTNLYSKISPFWGSGIVWAIVVDSINEVVYLGGSAFAKYAISTDTATNLTPRIPFCGEFEALGFDATNNQIYAAGCGFIKYSVSTDTGINLSSELSFTPVRLTMESANGNIYLLGREGQFGKYTISTATAVDLTASLPPNIVFIRLIYDPIKTTVYLAGVGKFVEYKTTIDTATDLSESLSLGAGIYSGLQTALTNDSNGNMYIGTNLGDFGRYDPSTNALEDLTPKISALGAAWQNATIEALIFDSIRDVVYLGGFSYFSNFVTFAKYTISTDTVVDLSDRISSLGPDWESAGIYALGFDPSDGVVYLGGSFGTFARYNPASDTAYDLTSILSAAFPGNTSVSTLVFDEVNRVFFVGGDNSSFSRYNTPAYPGGGAFPDPDTAYYLGVDSNSVIDLAFDPDGGGVVYLAGFFGGQGEFIRYNNETYTGGGPYPDGNTAYNLTSNVASDLGLSIGQLTFSALTFEPLNRDVYMGTLNGRLLRYMTSTDTAAHLTSEISSFWGVPPANIVSLTFEPRTASVYIGGSNGKFAKIAVPNNAPVGTDVTVQPTDTTTGAVPATLTFSAVTQAGTTSLTTSSDGPVPPAGFSLGDPPTYYELSTTAVVTGPITVCINYSGVETVDESQLRLFHFENGAWEDRTTSLDTIGNIICAGVDSLSPFAIFEPSAPADSDGDGVLDMDDSCPDTPSGVLINAQGCSGAQFIVLECPGTGSFPNRGQYVSCVAHAANDAASQGLITLQEKARFVWNAAHAN